MKKSCGEDILCSCGSVFGIALRTKWEKSLSLMLRGQFVRSVEWLLWRRDGGAREKKDLSWLVPWSCVARLGIVNPGLGGRRVSCDLNKRDLNRVQGDSLILSLQVKSTCRTGTCAQALRCFVIVEFPLAESQGCWGRSRFQSGGRFKKRKSDLGRP